jgi:hypothetical protein
MLHSLDLLIGFATVMAALSLVVTVLTQIAADALQLRATHLREGLLEILGHAGIEIQEARRILDLSHLSGSTHVTASELSAVAGGADFSNLFDAAMRKVSNRFTTSSRLIAAAISLVVACGLPLDMLDLFRTFSSGAGALLFPQTLAQWMERWRQVNLAGVAGSAVLLSLGAPFWFEVLKDLLKLQGAQSQ